MVTRTKSWKYYQHCLESRASIASGPGTAENLRKHSDSVSSRSFSTIPNGVTGNDLPVYSKKNGAS